MAKRSIDLFAGCILSFKARRALNERMHKTAKRFFAFFLRKIIERLCFDLIIEIIEKLL